MSGWLIIAGALALGGFIAWFAHGLDDHDDWMRSRSEVDR